MKRGRFVPMLFAALFLTYPAMSLQNGDIAPKVMLFTTEGGPVNTLSFKNRNNVILSFFLVPCPPCEKELPRLQKLQERHGNLKVILISDFRTDSQKAIGFLKEISGKSGVAISLPVLLDRFGDVSTSYGVTKHPTTFLIDRKGNVVLRVDGYNEEKAGALESLVERMESQ